MTVIRSKYPEFSEAEYLFPAPGGTGACAGCPLAVALKYILKTLGDKLVLLALPGCTSNMMNAPKYLMQKGDWNMQEYSVPLGTSAACAAGLKSAFATRGDTETQVMVFAGDGATFDAGLQSLSAAAERNDDIIFVCCDNEGYQNTGNQRSSATPLHGITTTTPYPATKAEPKKDIMLLVAAHRIPYAATATVAFPEDAIRKVQTAKTISGFRFLQFLVPCVAAWGIPSERTIEVSRLAVETKYFPLFEVRNGTDFTINKTPKGLPITEYTKVQGRYRHFTAEQLAALQQFVDERWRHLNWLAGYDKPRAPKSRKTA